MVTNTNIINGVRHPTQRVWTWRCSCGVVSRSFYSSQVAAITTGRRIHRCAK